MNDKSERQIEKIIVIATIIIFILLLFLKTADSRILQEIKPSLAGLSAGCADERAGQAVSQENIFQEETNLAVAKTDKDLKLDTKAELLPRGQASKRNLRVDVQISNESGTTASDILLEIPLLGDLDSPYQILLQESFTPEPLEINMHDYDNRTGTFKIGSLAAGTTKTVTFNYLLNVIPLTVDFSHYDSTPAFSAKQYVEPAYLNPALKIESDHPEIKAKAREATDGLTNVLDKARALFEFTIRHMSYDLDSASRNSGALSALHNGSGVCEDYAALFVALCRAEGIPARLVNGYTDPRGRGDVWNVAYGETFPLTGFRHSWAEFYLEGLGWLPADPTLDKRNREFMYFAALPQTSHLAQNYFDQPLRVRYRGGQLNVTWEEGLVGNIKKAKGS